MIKIMMVVIMSNAAHFEYLNDSYNDMEVCTPVVAQMIEDAKRNLPEAKSIQGFCMTPDDRVMAEAIFGIPSGD